MTDTFSIITHIFLPAKSTVWFTLNNEPFIRIRRAGECIFNSFSSNQRGAVILLNKKKVFKIIKAKNKMVLVTYYH